MDSRNHKLGKKIVLVMTQDKEFVFWRMHIGQYRYANSSAPTTLSVADRELVEPPMRLCEASGIGGGGSYLDYRRERWQTPERRSTR
jgi:hypothetical protein